MEQIPPGGQSMVPPPPLPSAAQPSKGPSGHTVAWIVGGIALVLVLLMLVFACGTCFMMSLVFRRSGYSGKGVGLIEITGVMTSDDSGYGGTSAASVVEQLDTARENDNIKAVLIRIDSPGGTPASAQEIYREIIRTREKKPVVVSIGDMGASAAYYVASASNIIFASPDSDVGSIGVIMEIPNVQGLNEKIGVQWYVLTQGQYKDMGSPFRPLTAQEQAILQGQMNVAYEHFISAVAEGRDMDEAKVRELANGLTYPGTQAKELGLIDEIGNYRDAATKAGRLGGITGDVHLIPMTSGGPFGLFSDFYKTFEEINESLKLFLEKNGITDDRPVER